MQVTIQTKVTDKKAIEVLEKISAKIGHLRAKLLKELLQDGEDNRLKKEYIKKYGITARQYNSLSSDVRGLIKSSRELKKRNLSESKARIKSQKHVIKKLEKKQTKIKVSNKKYKAKKRKTKKDHETRIKNIEQKKTIEFRLHHKKRKLKKSQDRIIKLESKDVRICLGGKKLFHAQFNLEDNGYKNHHKWKEVFQLSRNNRIFFIGSKDERFGNQNCQLIGDKLQVRILPSLEKEYGKYIKIPLDFSYGKDIVNNALSKKQAMNYRFVRKDKNWYLFLTTKRKEAETTTRKELGAIGVDLNKAHIAYAETNRHGNLVKFDKIITPIQDMRKHQVSATFGEAIKQIVIYAKKQNKPIVIEKLDFSKKKTDFAKYSKRYRRMLSYFAYAIFYVIMRSRAYREGVRIISVNPAFSSVIGKYKFAKMYGISVHIAASLVLARRACRYSEKLPKFSAEFKEKLPTKTAQSLAEHRYWHVWKHWNLISRAVSNRERRIELNSRLVSFRKKQTCPLFVD